MSEVDTWALSAGGNNAAAPDGFPEGMLRRDFNDAAREVMAGLARAFANFEYRDLNQGHAVTRPASNQFKIAGIDLTGVYTAERRVKYRVGSGSYASGKVVSSSFSVDTTVTVSGALVPVGTDNTVCYVLQSIRGAAFVNTGTAVGEIPLNTTAAALGSAAYKNQSNTTGDVPVHSQTGPLASGAYVATGNSVGLIPLNTTAAALAALAYRAAPARAYARKTSNQTVALGGSLVAITGLSGIAVPGTPDGVKKYRVTGLVTGTNAGAGNSDTTLTVHLGAAGTASDAAVAQMFLVMSNAGAGANLDPFPGIEITPASGDKVTVSLATSQRDITVLGHATIAQSWLEIQEVL